MNKLESFLRELPSPEQARRFFEQFRERSPAAASQLVRNEPLFSDVLALASYSPLLAATLLQHPEYVAWLQSKRSARGVASKEDLLESLGRFTLMNSQTEPHILLARFRRRELLRIFLRDIRRLETIVEVTEEISNLADCILEYAVRIAKQEMDNRFGPPFEADDKGRRRPSEICVVSLGKLGSRELNYSSDIDLQFIYSSNGSTAGAGGRQPVTNREYFEKLAGRVIAIVGQQGGEGAAYRVDMRLRPHGRIGPLALSLSESVRYYLQEARSWEQQVLIRSRCSAASDKIYRDFFAQVEPVVFEMGRDPGSALRDVYQSKQKIDQRSGPGAPFDVKLGRGGIREIEFIAQALQLAHGGKDRWLRSPHTLIAISRLADHRFLTEDERSGLSNAYDFLRRLEHILQMENGLQTHEIPSDTERAALVAARMNCADLGEFRNALATHTGNVHSAFERVFSSSSVGVAAGADGSIKAINAAGPEHDLNSQLSGPERDSVEEPFKGRSPKFTSFLAARPWLTELAGSLRPGGERPNYRSELASEVNVEQDRGVVLTELRRVWSRCLIEIASADILKTIDAAESRTRQTLLAEASIETAVKAAGFELSHRHGTRPFRPAILALGKLGSGTLDYESDIDILVAYPDGKQDHSEVPDSEFYSRGVEAFINFLSGMTREGNLYRVDLRLRPHGRNGAGAVSGSALADYIRTTASTWELLAYAQLRRVRSGADSTAEVEMQARSAIEDRAAGKDRGELVREAREMRLRLEKQHGSSRDVNIKFSAGGLLDVYFIVRTLQLLNYKAEGEAAPRSTREKLSAFHEAGIISTDDFTILSDGHGFLSRLDHSTRLVIGRQSRLPEANKAVFHLIAERMGASSPEALSEELAMHRLDIREVFDRIMRD